MYRFISGHFSSGVGGWGALLFVGSIFAPARPGFSPQKIDDECEPKQVVDLIGLIICCHVVIISECGNSFGIQNCLQHGPECCNSCVVMFWSAVTPLIYGIVYNMTRSAVTPVWLRFGVL